MCRNTYDKEYISGYEKAIQDSFNILGFIVDHYRVKDGREILQEFEERIERIIDRKFRSKTIS